MSEQYSNKIIVAPMVRVGTLPFRLLAIDYGADLVYTQETIDYKMLRSIKKENVALGTTDFVDKSDGTVFWRTCPKEKKYVIFQMGTNDPQRALKVAKMVEPYVAGVDINMGCPKIFSLKGGMGAALLTQPEKVKSILTTLVQGLDIPVTCKIRILPSIYDTINLCQMIESCGVAALAVHGRTKDERPNNANHNDVIKKIASIISIPVIANGGSKEISQYSDIENFRQQTGSSSVMLARAVMWNCSILREQGSLPIDTIIECYLNYCIDYDNPFTFTKYTVQNILRNLQDTLRGKAFLETQTLQEICVIWGLGDYFKEVQEKHSVMKESTELEYHKSSMPPSIDSINISTCQDNKGFTLIEAPIQFIRGNFCDADLPKMLLNNYVYRHGIKIYKYTCKETEKFFNATVIVGDIKYSSTIKEKSRRYAEQAAAMVSLHSLCFVEKDYGFVPAKGARKYQYIIDQENEKREKNKKLKLESVNNGSCLLKTTNCDTAAPSVNGHCMNDR